MESRKSPRKRGQLSLDEEKFIRDNFGKLSISEIADSLNRNSPPIQRYIDENRLAVSDEDTGELLYFEDTWIGLIKQFREDVLPAEELQIKQFITIDILINRSMKERKRHIAETEKLQRQVDKEYEKTEIDRDIPKLANLETQLSFARNSIANYTNEYTKLLNEQQKISKDLKATREQRIKRIEDGKSSWVGLIRMLEDEEVREKEGREMEILSMATDKYREKLESYHSYEDRLLDKPFLTPDSVEDT